jgi:hypothetical protein
VHGEMMNDALRKSTADYVVFADCDICILYPDWDKVIFEELIKNVIFGIEYPKTLTRYRRFPTSRFFAFQRGVLVGLELDFKCGRVIDGKRQNRSIIDCVGDAEKFNLCVGDRITYDTGWELPHKINRSYNYYAMKAIGIKDNKSLLSKYSTIRGVDYNKSEWNQNEWHYKGKVFVTHKHCSRKHPLTKINGLVWKYKINNYTKKEFGFVFDMPSVDSKISTCDGAMVNTVAKKVCKTKPQPVPKLEIYIKTALNQAREVVAFLEKALNTGELP